MHARARTRALTALVALTLGATLATMTPAYAEDVDPQAPVVVNDTITLWPGQSGEINVLDNDTDPAGDDLAVCRLPGLDLTSNRFPQVFALDASQYGLPAGTVEVGTSANAHGTHTIDYYVCNHTRLTPATLTVTIRPVAPVTVTKVDDQPGRLSVTNENDKSILLLVTDRTGCKRDAMVRVGAHDSRVVRVKRHRVNWVAMIGRGGIADHGHVSGIELDGPPAPAGNPHHGCSYILTGALTASQRLQG